MSITAINFIQGKFNVAEVKKIIEANFKQSELDITSKIEDYAIALKQDISFIAEYPYNDAVYRDTYYHYFATKLDDIGRHCIRICLFEGHDQLQIPLTDEDVTHLQSRFLGYIILRPLPQAQIGRSFISPKALVCPVNGVCLSKENINLRGVKLEVEAFPHASQDMEMGRCAETAIWSLMRYFSNKYSDYQPAMPSKIVRVLEYISPDRQVPSEGLNDREIASVIKSFGLPTRSYAYGDDTASKAHFKHLALCYALSGIPTLLISSLSKESHVMIVVGYNASTDKFYVQDDNQSPYVEINIHKPFERYTESNDEDVPLQLMVPLHKRIHLEAERAMKLMRQLPGEIDSGFGIKINGGRERVFLASTRTWKRYILTEGELNIDVKNILLELNLPKFIWIAEYYTCDTLVSYILLDATEPAKTSNQAGLICVFNHETMLLKVNKELVSLQHSFGVLNPFNLNLYTL